MRTATPAFLAAILLAACGTSSMGAEPDATAEPSDRDGGAVRPDGPAECTVELETPGQVLKLDREHNIVVASSASECSLVIGNADPLPIDCNGTATFNASALDVGSTVIRVTTVDGDASDDCEALVVVVYPGACVSHIDAGDDGVVDILETSIYNADGQKTSIEVDRVAAEANDGLRTRTYENGRLVQQDVDDPIGGELESRTLYFYDDEGRQTGFERQRPPGAAPDLTGTYTRDENGILLYREDDVGADGTLDRRYTYYRNDAGYTVRQDRDNGIDGVVNERWTFTVAPEGHRTHAARDNGLDGTIDRRVIYDYSCW